MTSRHFPPLKTLRLPRLLLVLGLFLPCFASAEESPEKELPRKSAQLVKKLKDYETLKLAELEKDLARVRSQVVESLKDHLKTATKAGKLEDAIAIRDQIKILEAKLPEANRSKSGKGRAGDETEFTLESRGPRWTKSKIKVRKGQSIRIRASGTNNLSTQLGQGLGPDGIPDRNWGLDKSFDTGLLLCRISGDPETHIGIGKRKTFKAEASGELEFTVNDAFLGDNSGSFDLTIKVK